MCHNRSRWLSLILATYATLVVSACSPRAATGIAFDQLDLVIVCEPDWCIPPNSAPGAFDADYAHYSKLLNSKARELPGELFHVAYFGDLARVDVEGFATICNRQTNDLTILDPKHHLFWHSRAISNAIYGPPGCANAKALDVDRDATRKRVSDEALPPITVDGITAGGRRVTYWYTNADLFGHSNRSLLAATRYLTNETEPCPALKPVMAYPGYTNTCESGKRFLIYRRLDVVRVEKGSVKPVNGRGYVSERGNVRVLTGDSGLFKIPVGYEDACAKKGRDRLGMCGNEAPAKP